MAAVELNKPPPLPSYPQLIIEAIEALNDKNGSNKTSILKYIESKYGELAEGHNGLVTHHLNKMKETGELVFWKNNYMKPNPNAPPRRGRGRPPKPKSPSLLQPKATAALKPSRPRGRPPKDPNAPLKPPAPKASGRPRGRPPKMARPAGGITGTTATAVASVRRGRGRPPKVKVSLAEVSA